MNENEEFEAFWKREMNIVEFDLHKHVYPMNRGWSYACYETSRAWFTWQAARATPADHMPDSEDM